MTTWPCFNPVLLCWTTSSLSYINEYLAIDSGGYFCLNSRRTLTAMWLDASERSRNVDWIVTLWRCRMCNTWQSETLYKNFTCFLPCSSSVGDSCWPWPLLLQDSFVVRSFNPARNPCPLINELSLKLARKCVKAFGTLSYDQTTEIHNLSEFTHFWNYNKQDVFIANTLWHKFGPTQQRQMLESS